MSDKLSEELAASLKEAFDQYDKDGTGEISIDSLADAIKAGGKEATDDELKKFVRFYLIIFYFILIYY
jgi:Ca2+-binding EF-hand superfamily protein